MLWGWALNAFSFPASPVAGTGWVLQHESNWDLLRRSPGIAPAPLWPWTALPTHIYKQLLKHDSNIPQYEENLVCDTTGSPLFYCHYYLSQALESCVTQHISLASLIAFSLPASSTFERLANSKKNYINKWVHAGYEKIHAANFS